MPQGVRIYNLFPLLVGNITEWEKHLDRIAEMGFDWIFLNPIHYPGFSGSLYAVKDYFALNPLFDDGSGDTADAQKLLGFNGKHALDGLVARPGPDLRRRRLLHRVFLWFSPIHSRPEGLSASVAARDPKSPS